ncbi:hypothetical protein F4680DRAFT_409324 [Xylaria scruposa]|nr:hypothetical protein F4680DRAFT_409324 [Xylaria scruposa]
MSGEDPHEIPALEAPEGFHTDFDDPNSIHYQQVAVASAALAICTLTIAARTYVRARVMKKFDLTDVSLLLSLSIFVAFVALAIKTGEYGQGHHLWNVRLSDFMELLKIINALEILYPPLVFFAKYVVLRQIETTFFQHQSRSWSYWSLQALIWTNLFFYTAFFFSFIFACTPREKIWNVLLTEGTCIDNSAALISSSGINLVSDTAILILPLATIFKLQMSTKNRLQVGGVFAIGVFAITASAVRLYYTVKLTKSQDTTYVVEPFGYWSEIEYASIILVACFPLFPLLFRHLSQQRQKTTTRSKSSSQGLDCAAYDQNSFTKLRDDKIQDTETGQGFEMGSTQTHVTHSAHDRSEQTMR